MKKIEKDERLEEVMIEYGDELLRLAYSYVKNVETAKDMVQNTFVKCYENLDAFREESTIRTWLYRITINQCKDYLKSWHYRSVQMKEFFHYTTHSLIQSPIEMVSKQVVNDDLKEVILTLPAKYREVIFLYYYQEYKIDEIATLIHLNENTVKSRLRRARQRLRIMVEEEDLYGSK